ncbi:motility associated factor glycosyltransferase family protein [Terribacillus sp. DMT04]|uniref:motility associated factor glycosyltransferase family protein n=1 Tax=Terribacillus sp. DMT04 TaxID=2850441 RepID=UPI001C2C1E5C|nr:6-hydroxymethylpterin diphosphokinase MptE-like protein [Terribacillus sp. DMT04]QXE00958.1 DUF115 domain-containing protein [Terribacillus sp. DMT04]
MENFFIKKVIELNKTFFIYNQPDAGKKVYLNSNFSSEKEAEKFVKQIKSEELNIIIGVGNGTIIEQLNKLEFIHCLIIEPYTDVKLSERTQDIIDNNNKMTFYHYENINPLIINGYIKKFLGVKSNLLIHPRYEKTNVEQVNEILDTIKNGLLMLQLNKNTEKYFKKDWIIQPLLNLEYTLESTSIDVYKNKFRGETALLVASGPSMKENIPFIKKMKDKAHLFSVGSALNGLLSHNIVPDYVTVIDSSIKNYTAHFQGVNYSGPLIVSGIINSKIFKMHKGNSILANIDTDSITPRFRKEVPCFPGVPSVAVFSLQILYYLGFSNVYLVGQDLALLNGEYYAEGVRQHDSTNNYESQLLVDSNNGSKVGTLFSLFAHLESFNNLIGLFDKEKMKIFNLSKNGARIKGTEYINPESVDIMGIKDKKSIKNIPIKSTHQDVNVIKNFVSEISQVKNEIDAILKKLNKINARAVSLNDLRKVLKLFKEIRKNKMIEEIFLNQLSFYVQRINNKFEYNFEKEVITNQDRVEMVNDIIKLTREIHIYLIEVLCDPRIEYYLE